MYQHTSILVLFTSIFFFTTAGHAEDNSLESLLAQVAAAHNQIKDLQKENRDLKRRLASYENEAAGYRLALENIDAEIAALGQE